MKPDLRSLTLYEAFIDTKSNSAYTKAIGLVPIAQKLPQEWDQVVKKIFNKDKIANDVVQDTKLMLARN